MKNLKSPFAMLCMALVAACFHVSAWAQSANDKKVASLSASASSIRWDVSAANSGGTVTIAAPDGQVFRKEFRDGTAEFGLTDNQGGRLPDGEYTYEIRVAPVISSEVKEALSKAREKGNDAVVERDFRKRGMLPAPLVESGGFWILNGSVIVAGGIEDKGSRAISKVTGPRVSGGITDTMLTRRQFHHARMLAMPDFVIADDLIVQGSACVGLDCVDGEVFGFDTIRMKENNTRLQYDDTSTTAGFPTNN